MRGEAGQEIGSWEAVVVVAIYHLWTPHTVSMHVFSLEPLVILFSVLAEILSKYWRLRPPNERLIKRQKNERAWETPMTRRRVGHNFRTVCDGIFALSDDFEYKVIACVPSVLTWSDLYLQVLIFRTLFRKGQSLLSVSPRQEVIPSRGRFPFRFPMSAEVPLSVFSLTNKSNCPVNSILLINHLWITTSFSYFLKYFIFMKSASKCKQYRWKTHTVEHAYSIWKQKNRGQCGHRGHAVSANSTPISQK